MRHFLTMRLILVHDPVTHQLCTEDMTQLHALFKRALQIQGSSRDRITAVFFAHQLWSSRDKNNSDGKNKTDMLQHLSMHGVRDKVTDASLKRHDELQLAIVGLVNSVVEQALKEGELSKSKHLLASEIVFGLWSLGTGGQFLQASELPLNEFGIRNPNMVLLRTMILALDGLNWQPLHNEAHLKKLLKQLETQVFAEEIAKKN